MAERVHIDLIVLSACQTGAAESIGGYEYAGLTQAFHLARARSVIASLWKVDDPATARLIVRFYGNWLGGSDLARALSNATDGVASEVAVG